MYPPGDRFPPVAGPGTAGAATKYHRIPTYAGAIFAATGLVAVNGTYVVPARRCWNYVGWLFKTANAQ